MAQPVAAAPFHSADNQRTPSLSVLATILMPVKSNAEKPNTVNGLITKAVAQGHLSADPAQQPVISHLDHILEHLTKAHHATPLANKKSALGWLFGKKKTPEQQSPTGLYIWGGVGRGKSMLMDLFFGLAPEKIAHKSKKRIHFHAFMQDVHQRIHQWRQAQKTGKGSKTTKAKQNTDPILPLADALAGETYLLCFDEFAVSDVADAMILARLFTNLFERGVTLIATSNVQPDALYKNGLNRSFFLPFIDLVKARMDVLELATATDYRMKKLVNDDVYLIGPENLNRFDALWHDMTIGLEHSPTELTIKGRSLHFNTACAGHLRCHFQDLCEKPLGAGDYLAIAEHFHTFFIDGLRVLNYADRNAVKRFIALIDTLYDTQKIVIFHAEAAPIKLYEVSHGTEAFEFQRTLSRLQEMQSHAWLKRQ